MMVRCFGADVGDTAVTVAIAVHAHPERLGGDALPRLSDKCNTMKGQPAP